MLGKISLNAAGQGRPGRRSKNCSILSGCFWNWLEKCKCSIRNFYLPARKTWPVSAPMPKIPFSSRGAALLLLLLEQASLCSPAAFLLLYTQSSLQAAAARKIWVSRRSFSCSSTLGLHLAAAAALDSRQQQQQTPPARRANILGRLT